MDPANAESKIPEGDDIVLGDGSSEFPKGNDDERG